MTLPPILARDYRRNVVWPFVGALAGFAFAGAALGLIALVTMSMIR